MASTEDICNRIALSGGFKSRIRKKYGESQDKYVRALIELISADSFNEIEFYKILNWMIKRYQQVYLKLQQAAKIRSIPQQAIISANIVCNSLAWIGTELRNKSINENSLYNQFDAVKNHTNILHTFDKIITELDNPASLANTAPKKKTSIFKRIMIGLGIIGALGIGTGKMIDNNIKGNEKAKIERVEAARGSAETEAAKKVEAAKKAEAEKKAKEEAERIRKIREEYDQVKKNRKETMAMVNKILSESKMPTNYITPTNIKALIWAESRFDPRAGSSAGANGLMQVTKTSWPLKVSYNTYKHNIYYNIKAGLERIKEIDAYLCNKYGKEKWDSFSADRKIQEVLASYNCGPKKFWFDYHASIEHSNDETISHNRTYKDFMQHLQYM